MKKTALIFSVFTAIAFHIIDMQKQINELKKQQK